MKVINGWRYLKASLSVSTVLTTLIAAWLKKNNYVERINNLDKYLQKVTTLYFDLENIYINEFKDRCSYEIYIEKHKDEILTLLADVPSYSPYEYKKILYKLTKYFPDLIDGKYPWYDKTKKNNPNEDNEEINNERIWRFDNRHTAV